jgi:hypothetical protein
MCALLYASQSLDKLKVKGEDQKAGVELSKEWECNTVPQPEHSKYKS